LIEAGRGFGNESVTSATAVTVLALQLLSGSHRSDHQVTGLPFSPPDGNRGSRPLGPPVTGQTRESRGDLEFGPAQPGSPGNPNFYAETRDRCKSTPGDRIGRWRVLDARTYRADDAVAPQAAIRTEIGISVLLVIVYRGGAISLMKSNLTPQARNACAW